MLHNFRSLAIFVILAILMWSGCAEMQGYVRDYAEMAKEKGISGDYLRTLRKWTREKTVYAEFATRFYVAATYRSAEMTRAFLEEQARLLHLDGAEKARRQEIQNTVTSEYTSFFFYAYTEDRQANDFGERDSMWRVYLRDGKGSKINPVEIRSVGRITPEIEAFYPYVNRYYGRCYNVKFPKQSTEELTLVFTSVLGHAELSWQTTGK
ncbi:MAG: hypothetical protein N2Z74_03940 [Syntrophales bacterium]|nr:hypothetical protein [Syntrophales bacterium]